jgi:hypothetical protein
MTSPSEVATLGVTGPGDVIETDRHTTRFGQPLEPTGNRPQRERLLHETVPFQGLRRSTKTEQPHLADSLVKYMRPSVVVNIGMSNHIFFEVAYKLIDAVVGHTRRV